MEPPNPVAATMLPPARAGNGRSGFDTALHWGQRGFMKGASRGRQHKEQQAVALWIQQPGLSAERFLPRRIF